MNKIEEKDLAIIDQLAEKYGLTRKTFCNEILKMNTKTYTQVRFTEDEYLFIKKLALEASLTLNAFVNMAVREVIKNIDSNGADRQDMLDSIDHKKKDRRVNINFNNIVMAERVMNIAGEFGMPFPSFVRYSVLKYIKNNYDV